MEPVPWWLFVEEMEAQLLQNLSFAGRLKTEMNSAELHTTSFATLMNIESYFLLMLEL